MSEELKPCPFCGSKKLILSCYSPLIECGDCHAFGPGNADLTYDEAVELWNTRMPEKAIAATLGGGECENLIDPWGVHESFENDFECSACHASGHANGNIDHGEFLYCPRCGAKVREAVER